MLELKGFIFVLNGNIIGYFFRVEIKCTFNFYNIGRDLVGKYIDFISKVR